MTQTGPTRERSLQSLREMEREKVRERKREREKERERREIHVINFNNKNYR